MEMVELFKPVENTVRKGEIASFKRLILLYLLGKGLN